MEHGSRDRYKQAKIEAGRFGDSQSLMQSFNHSSRQIPWHWCGGIWPRTSFCYHAFKLQQTSFILLGKWEAGIV